LRYQPANSRSRRAKVESCNIEFNADGAGSVTYKFEDSAEQQLQMLVTIRSRRILHPMANGIQPMIWDKSFLTIWFWLNKTWIGTGAAVT
jgi:hypothetical protein